MRIFNRPITIVLVVCLVGCTHDDSVRSVDDASSLRDDSTRSALVELVEFAHAVTLANEVHWGEMYEQAAAADSVVADATTKLRLAIVLSAAERERAGAGRARQLFSEVLDDPHLPVDVRAFVHLQLSSLNEQQTVTAVLERTRVRAEELAREVEQLTVERQVVDEEIRTLHAALAEANAKLDALKAIEQNIELSNKSLVWSP